MRPGRNVSVCCNDKRDFLILVEHLIFGEHRRYVARKRRHVVQAQRLEIGRSQHRQHAGDGLGLRSVDLLTRAWACGERVKSP